MLNLIEQLLLWLRGGSLKLLTLAGLILLVWGTVSPVGTLIWWVKEGSEKLGLTKKQPKRLLPTSNSNPVATSKLNCYVIFLTGVGDFSTDRLTPGEEVFLKGLVKAHPNCAIVEDVFPYSAANVNLGSERLLAPLWNFAEESDGWLSTANVLIKIRNLWRFAISADNRYGPVYNRGIALAIVDRMNAAQPIPQSSPEKVKIILMGTSGGAQVALAAAPYLEQWLNPKIIVVSIGGVFAGTEGFNVADRVYHVQGRRDWVEDIGSIVFPSRWAWTVGSPFNQALREGRYTVKISGAHEHDGDRGYLGTDLVRANGISYVNLTLQKVNQLPIWPIQKRKQQ